MDTTADKSIELVKPDDSAPSDGKAKKEVTALSLASEAPSHENAIAVSPMGSIWDRPVMPGAIEVAEVFSAAGDRPIASSNLHIVGTILNNRPIMASDIRVLDTTLIGGRPVFASEMVVRDNLTLPGGRPVMASDPHLLEATLLPGGRPIASNEIDDSETLMGFLD